MDGATLVEILTVLATTCNVTPEYRALFAMDGHGSRLEKSVVDAIEALGWVLVLFPGALTHILQPMDAVFQEVRRVYSPLMTLARSNNFGSVKLDCWLGCWDKACVAALGGDEGGSLLQSAFKNCGVWPVNCEHVLTRMAHRRCVRERKTKKARDRPEVEAADDPRLEIVLKRHRKRKALRQGLTLVHFSAQLESCMTQEHTPHTLNTP